MLWSAKGRRPSIQRSYYALLRNRIRIETVCQPNSIETHYPNSLAAFNYKQLTINN